MIENPCLDRGGVVRLYLRDMADALFSPVFWDEL